MKRRTSGEYRTTRPWLVAVLMAATLLSFFANASTVGAQDLEFNEPDATAEADAPATGSGVIGVRVFECPVEFRGASAQDYVDACTVQGMEDVQVRLTTLSIDEVRQQTNGGGQGGAVPTEYDSFGTTVVSGEGEPGYVEFGDLPANDYTIVLELPGATNNFLSYCSDLDTGNENVVAPKDENNGALTLEDGQRVICDWYVIPDPNGTLQAEAEAGVTVTPTLEGDDDVIAGEGEAEATATTGDTSNDGQDEDGGDANLEGAATAEPTEEPNLSANPPDGDVGGAADGASITIDMRTCPDTFVDPNAANQATFADQCAEGTGGVTLRLTDASGNGEEQLTDPGQNNTFDGLADGTYTLYSDIPRDVASEYLFCVADGGAPYQKAFNENGVTSFVDLTGEAITCSWYVVPQENRGEETGGSLTLHLASCPVGYTGDAYFEDCHGNGVDDSPFVLGGPATELTGTTNVDGGSGPGILAFTGLPAGQFTLQGGPGTEFVSVVVYCSDQGTNTQLNAGVDGNTATFTIAEGQDVLCDWYVIPNEGSGQTPTPTAEPDQRGEILITLFACAPSEDGYAGWGFSDLDDTCAEPVNDVPFRLGADGGTPLTADTGASGEGAVRFYDLLPGTYSARPTLPDGASNVALYCSLNGSNSVYQKSLENGVTTFHDLQGEDVACSWFITTAPVQSGPTGSITVREFICDGDKSTITDWDAECVAGASGATYDLTSEGGVSLQGTPGSNGVYTFEGLENDFYALQQESGSWCRATAENVDSSSRVIVKDGGNTDVYLFHCGDVTSLPSTGTGSGLDQPESGNDMPFTAPVLALVGAALALAASLVVWGKRLRQQRQSQTQTAKVTSDLEHTETGTWRMRFR
jgi:hypothetical protein